MSSVYGLVVKPGKPTPYVPPADGGQFVLRNASLAAEASGKSALTLKTEGVESELCLGVLSSKGSANMTMDLVIDEYAEFSVKGNAEIHLVGLMVGGEEDDDDDDDDDDMEVDKEMLKALRESGKGSAYGIDDDDDDDDDDDSDGSGSASEDDFVPTLEELPSQPTPPAPKPKANQTPEGKKSATKGKVDQPKQGGGDGSGTPTPSKKKKQKKRSMEDSGKDVAAEPEGVKEPKKQKHDSGTPVSTQEQSTPLSVMSTGSSVGPNGTPKKRHIRKFTNGFVIHNTEYGPPTGKVSKKGKTLTVTYVGKLADGKVFDRTKKSSTFDFVLGAGQVIRGWDKGLEDMRVGDSRRLTVPPKMAYGSDGSPPAIPANSTLTFDIKLVNVK